MHWQLKGLVQKVVGAMPAGVTLNYWLQRRFGGLRDFPGEFASKVEDWTIMTRHLRDAGRSLTGARLLEIGTGWYPTFPLACYLAGARQVSTFDLNRHLKPELTRACIALLGEHLPTIAAKSGEPLAEDERGYAVHAALPDPAGDPTGATGGVVHYRAPADATRTGLPAASVDVVFSNSVLEHVPPDVIRALYDESRRVLSPGGLMFHSVNCGDHYAYVDRRINQLNYLQYPDRAWAFWNNRLLYQNRLRAHRFVDDAVDAGFDIVLNTANARPERLQQLRALKIAPQFAAIAPEQLCITSVDFIGRVPA